MTDADWISSRVDEGHRVVRQILAMSRLSFSDLTPSKLPEKPGLYVITRRESDEVLRAGRTVDQTLRNRIYRNHLMGSQPGNLRAQLVGAGMSGDMEKAKRWMREHCEVQFLGQDELHMDVRWAEHFLLAILRPTFSD